MFTPLVGVPMENSLDLVIVWAMYGSFMCKTFWPIPNTGPSSPAGLDASLPIRWPKKAHPGALSEAGQERTPWLTRWARARVSLHFAALGRIMQSIVPAW